MCTRRLFQGTNKPRYTLQWKTLGSQFPDSSLPIGTAMTRVLCNSTQHYWCILTSFAVIIVAFSTSAFGGSTYNLDDGVALGGYDPISFFTEKKPKKGKSTIVTEFDGVKYQFSSEANKKTFDASPKKYQPAYGGWCATATAGGYKYPADPTNYVVTDGRLFVFYKGLFGNSKNPWVKDEPNHIKKADKNWPEVKTLPNP